MLIGILFFITVIFPVLFWFRFFSWHDRAEPEPKRLLITTFLLGIGVAVFATAVEITIFSVFLPEQYKTTLQVNVEESVSVISFGVVLSYFLPGVIEEILKFLALKEFVYSKTDFNQIADGVFYAVTIALGFSFLENSLYFYQLYSNFSTNVFIVTSVMRGIATMLLHVTASGIVGYAAGKMKFSKEHSKATVLRFLLLAIFIHGLFNIFLLFQSGALLALLLALISFLYLLYLLNKPETKLVWKLIAPQKNF